MDDAKTMFAVPTRGVINWNTAQRLLVLQEQHPQVIFHIEAHHLNVGVTRNRVVKKFLNTDCQVLFMCDDDVIPRLNILEMADHAEDIVGASYYIVRSELNLPFPAAFKTGSSGAYVPLDNVFSLTGVQPAEAVGTGCIMIKRPVLEHPEMRGPFSMLLDDDGDMVQSDDIAFCHRARALGFRIAMDFDRHCDHVCGPVSINRIHFGYRDAYARARTVEREKPRVVLAQ